MLRKRSHKAVRASTVISSIYAISLFNKYRLSLQLTQLEEINLVERRPLQLDRLEIVDQRRLGGIVSVAVKSGLSHKRIGVPSTPQDRDPRVVCWNVPLKL